MKVKTLIEANAALSNRVNKINNENQDTLQGILNELEVLRNANKASQTELGSIKLEAGKAASNIANFQNEDMAAEMQAVRLPANRNAPVEDAEQQAEKGSSNQSNQEEEFVMVKK